MMQDNRSEILTPKIAWYFPNLAPVADKILPLDTSVSCAPVVREGHSECTQGTRAIQPST